jgi:hypothetical protein
MLFLNSTWNFIFLFSFLRFGCLLMTLLLFFKQAFSSPSCSVEPVSVYFRQIMRDTVRLPLDIDLHPAAQAEPLQANLVTDVGKHRFHDPQAPAVLLPSLRHVDLLLHLRSIGLLRCL